MALPLVLLNSKILFIHHIEMYCFLYAHVLMQ
jgi:hypothetical protein